MSSLPKMNAGDIPKVALPPVPGTPRAKVAPVSVSQISIEDVTEMDLMELDNLEAKSLHETAMLSVKPEDKSMWLFWANWKNNEGARIHELKSKGFRFAVGSDIEGGLEAIIGGNTTVDGQIRSYDVVLMIGSKLSVMQHFKHNLLRSQKALRNVASFAKNEAEGFIRSAAGTQLANARQAGHRVEFYNPSAMEVEADEAAGK